MIAVSQTKSANYLFIVAVLKSMREGGVITQAEYERAKRYYQTAVPGKAGRYGHCEPAGGAYRA